VCGPESNETTCTAKLLLKHATSSENNVAVFPYLYRFTMTVGHQYLHAVWKQTLHWWETDCCNGTKLRTSMDSITDFVSHFS
jgi:hypothetical protein